MPKCSRVEDSGVGQAKNNKMGTTPASSKKSRRQEEQKDKHTDHERWALPRMRIVGGSRMGMEQPLQTWDVQVLAKK